MMQPTPAPSTPPTSLPEASMEAQDDSYPIPPQNIGSAPFGVLVGLFEKLQNERKQERRKKLIGTWFNHWREEVGHDLYPVLRLILPQKDRERAVYGVKEKNLAKIYIKLIPLGRNDPDAQRLVNWKKPTEREKASGDFPTVLYEVVYKRSSVIEGSMSIDELNETLNELSKCMGKQDQQMKILQRIYNRTTPEEQRWIIRIILKDMVISVKETTVFSVFHPDAQDLYNTCSDLKKVAWTLWDTSNKLDDDQKTVGLFQAFTPMLCKRPTRTIEQTVKEMGGAEFIIEEKLDGERIQLHKRGNEYYYCSRKGKDYTFMYGKHVGAGTLTPYIDKAFHPGVENIILDGEMLVWDPVSERNLPFGGLKTAALDKSKKDLNPRPCFKVFDLLYLNNTSLLDRSTAFRKKNLHHCLTEVKGRLEFVPEYKGKTAKDVRSKMEEIMETRGEGLVIKHPKAKYVLNGRNMDWIKVKPEYMDNMGETVDVLVVGGNYGTGSRGGGVSTLICAVLDIRNGESDDGEQKYSTFVRIGSGLSYTDYAWVRDKPWKPLDRKNPPEFLQTSKKSSSEDKGDVYLEPNESFILKVKAAEIVPSEQYHMGYTMRFPRALSIRDDLNLDNCMTSEDVLNSVRSEKKRKMEGDVGESKKKRRTAAKKATILSSYQGPKPKDVEVQSDLFKGLKFVVIPDPKSKTGNDDKNELVNLILSNGGSCMQIATKQADLFVVYGGIVTPYNVKLIIDKDIHDIIKPQWVTDSISLGRTAPLSNKYFFHATSSRASTDEYQDETQDETERQNVKQDVVEAHSDSKNEPESHAPTQDRGAEALKRTVMDPRLAEWLGLDETDSVVPITSVGENDSTSETENDSNNDDVAGEDYEEDWVQVQVKDGDANTKTPSEVSLKMGEDDSAMEYDQNLIFKHLCFYLDSPESAHQYGMSAKTNAKGIDQSFIELRKVITDNGGRVVGLDEGKLTHVVIDKRDTSRRVELMRRTSEPRRRHLVISEYIQACVDEGTLLDEDDFAP
ncbi:DNA ligase (ATP) [Marasmius oreades]|uniref:DNA ligase n=1 Tax=Marasmius oreades TaxID=181124 RepID=A0A9P7S1U9_9AGAR|nr:DNA ligase (ATP) [Marasmius oreades]KAG7093593.1 DNA ligase (ATP) [Marasmius oreades]